MVDLVQGMASSCCTGLVLSLDQNNVLQLSCFPKNGDFGFHLFENRYEISGGKLLPDVNIPYYVVGNLSYFKASKFPSYVREDYTGSPDKSNMDRIIVCTDNKWFNKVYVTQHRDRSNFSKHATYHISRHLIMIIKALTLEEFLLKTGYSRQQTNTTSSSIPAISHFTNQAFHFENESPPIMMNNNMQTNWISNLQPSSQDNQTTSTCTPTIIPSRKQDIDIESSPVSQMDSCVLTDDAQTPPSSIFGFERCSKCTIL